MHCNRHPLRHALGCAEDEKLLSPLCVHYVRAYWHLASFLQFAVEVFKFHPQQSLKAASLMSASATYSENFQIPPRPLIHTEIGATQSLL